MAFGAVGEARIILVLVLLLFALMLTMLFAGPCYSKQTEPPRKEHRRKGTNHAPRFSVDKHESLSDRLEAEHQQRLLATLANDILLRKFCSKPDDAEEWPPPAEADELNWESPGEREANQ